MRPQNCSHSISFFTFTHISNAFLMIFALPLKAGVWELATGNWRLGTGHWDLETGYWALETGNWRLGTGHWRLGTVGWRLRLGTGDLDSGR